MPLTKRSRAWGNQREANSQTSAPVDVDWCQAIDVATLGVLPTMTQRHEKTPERLPGERDFRWRGEDVSRIEGLSDGVFALTLTLLLFSQEIPKSTGELATALSGVVPFVATCALLGMIWHGHYLFFRRFGLRDGLSAFLNAVLLLLVLVYAYPLRFLAELLWTSIVEGRHGVEEKGLIDSHGDLLMPLYAAGFAAIHAVFIWLYRHAWRQRERLQLDELERTITRQYLNANLTMTLVGVLALLLALFGQPGLAGFSFFLIGPALGILHWRYGVRRYELRQAVLSNEGRPTDPT
ncbi:MAG: TMEM175 family protein [Planctomycetota bacterium]